MTADRATESRFARLARVCFHHPWRIVGAWVLVLVAVSFAAGVIGKVDSSNFRLPANTAWAQCPAQGCENWRISPI